MVEPYRLIEEYRKHADRLYSAVLADALDRLGYRDQALPTAIAPLDPRWKLFGTVRTLAMKPAKQMPPEPYAIEIQAIDALEPGDVLAIAMAGCPECAVWGELLSTAAKARGSAGVVMDGATRDAAKIIALDFPTFAQGTTPLDSKGRIEGKAYDEPVRLGRVTCRPGDLIFGDRDGVVVIPFEAAQPALNAALTKVTGEDQVRQELAAGRPVREVFAKYGIL